MRDRCNTNARWGINAGVRRRFVYLILVEAQRCKVGGWDYAVRFHLHFVREVRPEPLEIHVTPAEPGH